MHHLITIIGAVGLFVAAALSGCATPALGDADPIPPSGAAVPLTFESDLPVVDLSLQGRTLRMIVDLGGTDGVAITESVLQTLDATRTGRTRYVSDAFGTVRKSDEFIIPEASLNGIALRNVRGYEVHDERLSMPRGGGRGPIQLDGYIGLDLLRSFNVLLDYPGERIVLFEHEAPAPGETATWPKVEFHRGRMGVTTPVMLDGRAALANWDTGANHTVVRPDRVPADMPRWRRGNEEAVTVSNLRIGDAQLGPFDLVLLEFRQPRVDLILGTNLFRSRRVWLDFSRGQLAIEPGAAAAVGDGRELKGATPATRSRP